MTTMSSITCPRCGSPVPLRRFFSMTNKPFCPRCGWNLDRAEAALAGKATAMKLVAFAIAGLGIFAAFAAGRTNLPILFFLPVLFGAVILLPIWGYYFTRRAIAAAKLSVNPDLARSEPPLDPALQQLQSLSRPRRVRFRFGGNLVVVAGAFALTVLMGFALIFLTAARLPRNVPHPASTFPIFLPALFILLVFPAVIVIPILRDKRNLPLLRDGELAFARVTSQQTVQQGKASYSSISYEFKTNSGQPIQSSAKDLTYSVFEDMTIPVFYDPLDPSKNTTPCATYLRISSNPF